jgi:hypothetical protein
MSDLCDAEIALWSDRQGGWLPKSPSLRTDNRAPGNAPKTGLAELARYSRQMPAAEEAPAFDRCPGLGKRWPVDYECADD